MRAKKLLGGRVTVRYLDGEWFVISLTPAPGQVHIQNAATGELLTVRSRFCTYLGRAFDYAQDDCAQF